MSKIDYLKVIGVLSKTLSMEAVDVRVTDKSADTIDVILGGDSMREINFRLVVKGFTIELSFPPDYFSQKELDKFRLDFEYELEQAFLTNVTTRMDANDAGYVLTVSL